MPTVTQKDTNASAKTGTVASALKKSRSDFPYYAQQCLRITTKQGELVPLRLNAAQRTVHAKISAQLKDKGYVKVIILKARQEGVSTYTAGRFFRGLHLFPNRNALVMAHELSPGRALFGIYERYYRSLDGDIKPPARSAKLERQLWFDNPLDSKLLVDTANNKNAGRGSTIHMLHASELAFWENAADTWLSLMQAIPDKGSEVIIESTPNGVGNFFHQMWLDAEAGNSGFVPIFLPWWIHEEYEAPVTETERQLILDSDDPFERMAQDEGIEWEGDKHKLTPERLWWRRITVKDKCGGDERVFRQEYPSNARECFLVSGNCFFDEEKLQSYDDSTEDASFRGDLQEDGSRIVLRPGQRGYTRIWEAPRADGLYVIGADTASGRQVAARDSSFTDPESERGGRDFSCAWVFDVTRRKYVAKLHGRMAPDEFAKFLRRLGMFYACEGTVVQRPALLGVEKNHSSGETVLRILKDEKRYPNLYYSRQINRRTNRPTPVLGWVTSAETRMPMLDDFAQAIREESVALPCKDTVRECFTFVRGEDGKPEAQEGCHDDRVIAAAIAYQMVRYVTSPTRASLPETKTAAGPTGLWD